MQRSGSVTTRLDAGETPARLGPGSEAGEEARGPLASVCSQAMMTRLRQTTRFTKGWPEEP
jgi:hypothetical protein